MKEKENRKASLCSLLEGLAVDQRRVQEEKWRLRNLSLPVDCKIEDSDEYKSVSVRYVPVQNERVQTAILEEYRKYFPYELFNRVQSLTISTIYYTRECAMIAAPTGSGKTELAILSILKEYSIHKNRTFVVYIAPTKSLIKQIENTLKNRLGSILAVEQDTTDSDRSSRECNKYSMNILVTTPEKYDILSSKNRVSPSLLIVDEIHVLGESRGGVVESIIIRSRMDRSIRIIGMSGTVPNYRDIGEFIGAKEGHSYYFNHSYKEIPMEYTVIGVKDRNASGIRMKILKRVLKKEPTLIFISSKKECYSVGRELIQDRQVVFKLGENSKISLSEIVKNLSGIIPSEKKDRKYFMDEIEREMDMLEYGVGVHHSGMSKNMRAVIERLFLSGTISTICCTSTLSCGVNLPADSVIIYGTRTFHSSGSRESSYSLADISQMSGRSGRKGLSEKGSVIIITEIDRIEEYSRAATFQFPVESRLGETLTTRVLYEIETGRNSKNSLTQWIESTYAYRRGMKHKELKGYFTDTEKLVQSVVEYLMSIQAIKIEKKNLKNLKDLKKQKLDCTSQYIGQSDLENMKSEKLDCTDQSIKQNGLIEKEIPLENTLENTLDSTELTISLSEIGKVSFKYYLCPETVCKFNRIFQVIRENRLDLDVGDILLIVSTADEFASISEEHVNRNPSAREAIRRLESTVKYPIKLKRSKVRECIESVSAVQEIVSVLLQAHINRIEPEKDLYSLYTTVITGIERVIYACLAVGRKFLNRSIHSIVDLSISVRERDWRYSKERRKQEKTEISITDRVAVVKNIDRTEIFLTVTSSSEYTSIHTAITKRGNYYYKLSEKKYPAETYKLQVDTMNEFTVPSVVYYE